MRPLLDRLGAEVGCHLLLVLQPHECTPQELVATAKLFKQ